MIKKKLLIAGGSGLIGAHIQSILDPNKYIIYILSRFKKQDKKNIKYFYWNIDDEYIDHEAVKVDFIINLAGSGIADKRWTSRRKKDLISSRIKCIALLRTALLQTHHRPKCIISASAIGFYGDRNEEELFAHSKPGNGFLAETCVQWEQESETLKALTVRFIKLRIGIVLSMLGGALPKILMTKNFSFLNYFGSGTQYYSWIHISDLCHLMKAMVENESYHGIYNGVSPFPLRNKEMMDQIRKSLGSKHILLPMPVLGLRVALGEMADVVLNSNRVYPRSVLKNGFQFRFTKISDAVQNLIQSRI